jgi:hypothetical protein
LGIFFWICRARANGFKKNFLRNYPYELEIYIPIFKRFETYSAVKAKVSEFKSAQTFYDKTVSDDLYKAYASYMNLNVVI